MDDWPVCPNATQFTEGTGTRRNRRNSSWGKTRSMALFRVTVEQLVAAIMVCCVWANFVCHPSSKPLIHQGSNAFVTRFTDKVYSDFNHAGRLTDFFRNLVASLLNTAVDLRIEGLARDPFKEGFGVCVGEMLGADVHGRIVGIGGARVSGRTSPHCDVLQIDHKTIDSCFLELPFLAAVAFLFVPLLASAAVPWLLILLLVGFVLIDSIFGFCSSSRPLNGTKHFRQRAIAFGKEMHRTSVKSRER